MTKDNGTTTRVQRSSAHPSFQLYCGTPEPKKAGDGQGAVIVPQEELERRRALRRRRSSGDSIA